MYSININAKLQADAEARERRNLQEDIYELEDILNIPHGRTDQYSWAELRKRLKNLRSLAAQRPEDPYAETGLPAITWGQWKRR